MKSALATLLLLHLGLGTPGQSAVTINIDDPRDGSVVVGAQYANGRAASGADVRLEGLNGKLLLHMQTDARGEAVFDKPDEEYKIILIDKGGRAAVVDGLR